MDQDILYHLALGSGSHDLQEMFGDVKVKLRLPFPLKFKTLLAIVIKIPVRLHGRHAKTYGNIRTLHNGGDRLQAAGWYAITRH